MVVANYLCKEFSALAASSAPKSFLPQFNCFCHKPLLLFRCAHQAERARLGGFAQHHIGNHVARAQPVRLRDLALPTLPDTLVLFRDLGSADTSKSLTTGNREFVNL